MAIKVHCRGARFHASQVERIEQGFTELGHEVTQNINEAALVYVNDAAHYNGVIMERASGNLNVKNTEVIFNVLDLAPHLGSAFPLADVAQQLTFGPEVVTCISTAVQQDIATRLRIHAPIVYNPIKPVKRVRDKKYPYRVMFVGRVNDPEKRSVIAAEALSLLGFTGDEVVTVGNERPFYGGVHWGVADDATLNDLYNSVDFVMCPTRNAFLGLPALEAMAAGAIPVICNDMDVREEFFPSDVFPEYGGVTPDARSIARFMASLLTDDGKAMEGLKDRLHAHYVANWADRLSGVGVARAIVGIYEGLV